MTSLATTKRVQSIINIYEISLSYTFFKPLNLSRSNGQRKNLINANILINLIYYPFFNTFHTYL